MKKVNIYTDGACSGNPGPGGYGVILEHNGIEKELSGGEGMTTNNRMELTAMIKALSVLREPCEVTIYTDSRYCIDPIVQGWVYSWKSKGWRKSDGSSALNADLWEQFLSLLEKHRVSFVWIRGHQGHPQNERCDALAVAESEKHKKGNVL